jgi:glutamate-5-semialdehyde dehydrogenase
MGLAREIAEKAKKAQPQIARASSDKKNKILQKIAEYLEENIESILSANQKDLSNAEKNGANKALLDRLKLDEKRVKALIKSVEEIIKLPDPVGQNYRNEAKTKWTPGWKNENTARSNCYYI